MFRISKSFFIALILLVAGCGGGSGGSGGASAPPESRPNGSISGVAFDNLLREADIFVYTLNGELVGTGKTDNEGVYSVELKNVPSQPLRIESQNGIYLEEYTKALVNIDRDEDQLFALINYELGDTLDVSLTYFTTLATGYAEYLISIGKKPKLAIEEANNTISDWIGVDIVNIFPLDITNVENASANLNSGLKYAFMTAAISVTTYQISQATGTQPHSLYNSIRFAKKAYKDIQYDGLLNGIDNVGRVNMGTFQFSSSLYRNTHARNILVMANHPYNESSITPAALVETAELVNDKITTLFGIEPVIPFDSSKPLIEVSSLESGDAIWGFYDFAFNVTDITGIDILTVKVGDNEPVLVSNFNNPLVQIDTLSMVDGEYPLTIYARNFTGGEATTTLDIYIANNGLSISNLRPSDGQVIRGVYRFSASVTDSIGVESINFVFDGNLRYDDIDVNDTSVSIDTANIFLREGVHGFRVEATNTVNSQDSANVSFIVDNTAPSIEWDLQAGDYLYNLVDVSLTARDNFGVQSAKVYLDGTLIKDMNANGSQLVINDEFTFQTTLYTEGAHTFTFEVFDRAGGTYSESRTVYFDNQPPSLTINTPSNYVVTTADSLAVSAFDTLGFGANSIELYFDGVLKGTYPANSTSIPIDPAGYAESDINVSVAVSDIIGNRVTASIYLRFRHLAPSINPTPTRFDYSRSPESESIRDNLIREYFSVSNTGYEGLTVETRTTCTFMCWNPGWTIINGELTHTNFRGYLRYGSGASWDCTNYSANWDVRIVDEFGLSSPWINIPRTHTTCVYEMF